MKTLQNYLKKNSSLKVIKFFYDIETFQYNELAGKEKPTEYKNLMYSFAVSYFDGDDLKISIFNHFTDFLRVVINSLQHVKTKPRIELIVHNGNKYDNHFLRQELKFMIPDIEIKNLYLMNGTDEANRNSTTKKSIKKDEKYKGIILEKRVKSVNNLELNFFVNGVEFFTTDNWLKTNMKLETIGKKLHDIGVLTKDQLKTDYDYLEYNKPYDMTDSQAFYYSQQIFKNLSKDQLTYIRNDVIILAYCYKYYSVIFKGFDYNKMTATSNILDSYNDNNLTSFQLLNTVNTLNSKEHIKYTDYNFKGKNFYDYLKPYYRGGLNFYNEMYLNKKITERVFSIDINSSYPYSMHNFKIPTLLNEFKAFNGEFEIEINDLENENYYYLYEITAETFDEILSNLKSRVLRQMLIKYYRTTDITIKINTNTIRILKMFHVKLNKIKVLSYLKYDCFYFGSRKKIEEYYFIKTQGSQRNLIKFKNPYDIKITDEINEHPFSREEIDNSKVNLNGLYGIPALRPYFNVFRLYDNHYINIENGMENQQRNVIFSIFVTSQSLLNLLTPLSYLTESEIDYNFLYCDTDSLYLKYNIFNKIPSTLYHDTHLGKWGIDSDNISEFIVINHKKYAYLENNEIKIKAAGIPLKSFDKNVSFDEFIEKQFKTGVIIQNTKSIYNKQGTISIYPSETELQSGFYYENEMNSLDRNEQIQKMLHEIKSTLRDNDFEDMLYIESNLGTFSISELYPVEHGIDKTKPLHYLLIKQNYIKQFLELN